MSNPLIDNFISRLSSVDFSGLDEESRNMFLESMALYLSAVFSIGNMTDSQLKSFIKDTFEQSFPGVECTFVG